MQWPSQGGGSGPAANLSAADEEQDLSAHALAHWLSSTSGSSLACFDVGAHALFVGRRNGPPPLLAQHRSGGGIWAAT